MLGAAGTKSQVLTMEELEECQKYAKVDLLRTLRERSRADNNLRMFERSFYKKIKSATGPEAFNFEASDVERLFGVQYHFASGFGSDDTRRTSCERVNVRGILRLDPLAWVVQGMLVGTPPDLW